MVGLVVLARYEIERFLSEGGMGRAYLGRERGTNRHVVVRLLPEKLAAHRQFHDMFRREMDLLGRLRHPHAAALFESASQTPHGPCIVTEYVEGTPLSELLKREFRFSPWQTGKWLGQICSALQYAHGLGILHRDLKPLNIVIVNPGAPNETLKILDFGLAKPTLMTHLHFEKFPGLLKRSVASPEYMSPEQARGEEIDQRSDIYSLGIILFELLTGHRPFPPGTVQECMRYHLSTVPPSFAELGAADVSPDIEAIVQRCIFKYAAERPHDAKELVRTYERALHEKITVDDAAIGVTKPPSNPALSGLFRAPPPGTVVYPMEAWMPESIAVIKLQGFISGVGGEMLENVPGLLRVRLPRPPKPQPAGPPKSGLFGILGQSKKPELQSPGTVHMKLYMEKKDPNQPNLLSLVLVLSSFEGSLTNDFECRSFCEKTCRDICAFLMAKPVAAPTQ
jgi:eukaryotic-like serine/threonine-protein kinase